jgi:hypothetical protein
MDTTCCPLQIDTYTQAVKTVDIQKALGKPHSLWVAFAKFYERHGDLPNSRIIFEKAVQVGACPAASGGYQTARMLDDIACATDMHPLPGAIPGGERPLDRCSTAKVQPPLPTLQA